MLRHEVLLKHLDETNADTQTDKERERERERERAIQKTPMTRITSRSARQHCKFTLRVSQIVGEKIMTVMMMYGIMTFCISTESKSVGGVIIGGGGGGPSHSIPCSCKYCTQSGHVPQHHPLDQLFLLFLHLYSSTTCAYIHTHITRTRSRSSSASHARPSPLSLARSPRSLFSSFHTSTSPPRSVFFETHPRMYIVCIVSYVLLGFCC